MNNFVDARSAKGTAALFVSTDGGRPQQVDVGVYYRVPPDVSFAQVMFMGGALLGMVGLFALFALLPAARVPGARGLSFAGRRWLTVVAAAGVVCGVAASATAFSLANTARFSVATGW